AVWNPSTTQLYLPAGMYTQYRDLGGNAIPLAGSVTIGAQPILLEATGAPPPLPLQITTANLAGEQVRSAYNATLAASGGTAPYTWSVVSGALPVGLALSTSTGTISGTPTAAGQITFTVAVADFAASPQSASTPLSIVIGPVPLQITTVSLPGGPAQSFYN